MKSSRALVLLSGGIDTAVAALIARREAKSLLFVTFSYQQVNQRELACARRIARYFKRETRAAEHVIIPLDFTCLARACRSSLLHRRADDGGFGYYVPGRNLIFLTHAAAIAETEGISSIYVGSNFQDSAGMHGLCYPDSNGEFLLLAQKAIRCGLKRGRNIQIKAPLLSMNKFEAIRYGLKQGFDFGMTWSCYLNGTVACGTCPACLTRIINFHWAGARDPVRYKVSYVQALAYALSWFVKPARSRA